MPVKDTVSERWDNLIILDACRYDYFANIYKKYLKGRLQKAVSPGSQTIEFMNKAFGGKHKDIVYVSGNPYVNSLGTSGSRVRQEGYSAREHFYRIIDVWDWGYDEKKKAILPGNVRKAALKARKRYPNKRLVIHFMQPHIPYITSNVQNALPSGVFKCMEEGKGPYVFMKKAREMLDVEIERAVGNGNLWKIKDFFGIPPANIMEIIVKKHGKQGLRKAYEENLAEAMKEVKKLVKELDGRTVITSDHGERLGERNRYGHMPRSNDPKLRLVPWFEVEK